MKQTLKGQQPKKVESNPPDPAEANGSPDIHISSSVASSTFMGLRPVASGGESFSNNHNGSENSQHPLIGQLLLRKMASNAGGLSQPTVVIGSVHSGNSNDGGTISSGLINIRQQRPGRLLDENFDGKKIEGINIKIERVPSTAIMSRIS